MRQFCSIDIAKFVCALLVVVLHVATYGFSNMAAGGSAPTGTDNFAVLYILPICYVLLRIAVPFFFVASSYFLFKKINNDPQNSATIFKNFIKRILFLWLFWFVISLPYMIDKFFIVPHEDFMTKLIIFVVQIVLQGGFDGGWYLFATIVSASIIYATRQVSCKKIAVFCIFLYIIACFFCTYYNSLNFLPAPIFDALTFFNLHFPACHTFLSSTIFVFIGKVFAEKEKIFSDSLNKFILWTYPFFAYIEMHLCVRFSLCAGTDFFVTLLPFSIAFFQMLLQKEFAPKPIYKRLREYSTFIYLYHFVFLYCFYRICQIANINIVGNVAITIIIYFVTIATAILFCNLTQKFSQKKCLAFLKYGL